MWQNWPDLVIAVEVGVVVGALIISCGPYTFRWPWQRKAREEATLWLPPREERQLIDIQRWDEWREGI